MMTEADIRILSALAGLEGATTGHEKSEDTDRVVCEVLAEMDREIAVDDMIVRIHGEKDRIAPDCASCASPCGRTADQDIFTCLKEADEKTAAAMESLAEILPWAARAWMTHPQETLMEQIYTAIAYLGYGLEAVSYIRVTDKIRNMM